MIGEDTEIQPQRRELNEGVQASVENLDPEFLRAVKRELELNIADGRAKLVRNRDLPAPPIKSLPKFDEFVLPDATRVAANAAWDPARHPRGGHGYFSQEWDVAQANNWRPSRKDYRRILSEGRSAMERVIAQKKDAIAAIERPGLGKVDFRYGRAGTPPEFGDGEGVAKIIAKRDHEAKTDPDFNRQTGKHVARAMVETLLRGHVGQPYERGQKVNVAFKHFVATLRRDYDGKGNRWLLTGFIDRTKRKAAR